MGATEITLFSDRERLNKFTHYLIHDIKALEKMLAADMFETDIQRIGAEQELCLLDKFWRPASLIMDVLKEVDDPHFTTEHSQYNLEINLAPLEFSGNCFSTLEKALKKHLAKLNKALKRLEGSAVLVGILPTIRRSDLHLDNLTPLHRYHLLNDVLNKQKGGAYEFRIEGIDELITKHESIMFEGCNTSFQVHLQTKPDEFVSLYNWSQAITGPLLAVAVNSPLLLGKKLWQETRIALFQQSVDIRRGYNDLRQESSRISFGRDWIKKSITEIYQEDIVRHRVLIGTDIAEDSLDVLAQGRIPTLKALQIHNGTVYKWNRACYGITDGKPHLRIENRVLPSGPTPVDEVANAAFWLGMMNGISDEYRDIASKMPFSEAKGNFLKAARYGLETQFRWVNDTLVPANELILKELLPMAKDGLKKAGIVEKEINHYLGIIEARVKNQQTGSRWMIKSFDTLKQKGTRYEACVAITAGLVNRQQAGDPVHTWPLASIDEAGNWVNRYWRVEQIMYTDLFTLQESDPIYFANNVMAWKRLRYIPVENEQGELVGLLTANILLDYYSNDSKVEDRLNPIKDLMIKDPVTVSTQLLSVEALALMRKSKIGCLLVVTDKKLVGIVTELSFMSFSEHSIQNLIQESKNHL